MGDAAPFNGFTSASLEGGRGLALGVAKEEAARAEEEQERRHRAIARAEAASSKPNAPPSTDGWKPKRLIWRSRATG
jgi:hypothetical protein